MYRYLCECKWYIDCVKFTFCYGVYVYLNGGQRSMNRLKELFDEYVASFSEGRLNGYSNCAYL
ncbi:hypothetical protein bpSLO_001493 (plasmid) [Borrelia parkeri]|uniref:hypothetical protein n=1 Tax=Borrelia parkeri TaxID=141 RepID=UPI001FF112D1|nr:hypothetical protein [Borrelia parkeri]UPA11617.1 hypothetical protein bpSLO_001493 [Borrelia parkeri]